MEIDVKKYFLGQNAQFEFQADFSGLELDGVKPFCAPVEVAADIHGGVDSAELSLKVRYTLRKPCDRCGEETERAFETGFFHVLVPALSNEEDDDDFIVVPEERLDLDELVYEDVLLDMPHKFLCREDCKGLCQSCGKNLNYGDCGCNKTEIDPRLEVLKSFFE